MDSTRAVEEPSRRPSGRRGALNAAGRAVASRAAAVSQVRGVGAVVFLVLLAVIFQLMSGKFFSQPEIAGIFMLAAGVGCIAAGVTLLMISGEFDLSVGSVYAVTPIVMGTLINREHLPALAAFFAALASAAMLGLLNGLATTKLRIPSFITTLASLFVVTAIGYMITSGLPVARFTRGRLDHLLGGQIQGTPISAPFLWTLLFVGLVWFLHSATRYGNWCRAAAAPGSVARALGVPVNRVKVTNFVISSTLAGFAGCAIFMQLGSVDSSFGTDYNLLAIVAAVLGGTSLFGVQGSIIGSFVGALTLGSLQTGLVLVEAPSSWYTGLIGLLLVVAVLVNDKLQLLGATVGHRLFARQAAEG